MFLKKMTLCFVLFVGVVCIQSVSQSFADEVDMQEKYGYSLMDAPSGAKEMFYANNKKKWEDSIYSERRLFLERWEITVEQEEMRKERLETQLDMQKQEEDWKEQARLAEKQRKLQEREQRALAKETKKKQEKLRIKQKHEGIFDKMDKLKNKQQSRNGGR